MFSDIISVHLLTLSRIVSAKYHNENFNRRAKLMTDKYTIKFILAGMSKHITVDMNSKV